jgi:predicted metal-dependent phosphoesterase TrpH
MALTDHDTTAGWAVGIAEAHRLPITLIPGLELSTRLGWASVHLLGYLIDPTNAALVAETSKIRDGRRDRARSMVERIGRDYALNWDDVLAQTTPGGTVGRPHIADALVARGHVSDRSAAFATILHWKSGYYEPHYAPEPLEGVRLVRAAGGVPVLAHPGTNGRDRVIPEVRLAELVDAGLFGLEVDHRDNTESGRARLLELAAKYKLQITGSSDYHGTGKPNHLGENTTSVEVAEQIIAEATGFAPIQP